MEKRSKAFDVIKFIAIFLVVWGHSIMHIDHKFQKELVDIIYSFHMPLFMAVSGYFSASAFQRPLKKFTYQKIIQLLVPALTWSAIEVVWHYSLGTGYSLRDAFIGNSWFLKTLFSIYVAVYILKKTGINDCILFIVSCTLFFIIPGMTTLKFNEMYFYFWIGYFLRKYIIKASAMKLYSLICMLMFISLYILRDTLGYKESIPVTIYTLRSDTFAILINYSLGITGTIFIIYGLHAIERFINNWYIYDLMAKCGKYTLEIYVLQTFLLEFGLSSLIGQPSSKLSAFIICLLISACTIGSCILIIQLLHNKRLANTILFGKMSPLKRHTF